MKLSFKRLLAILLSIMMVVGMLPTAVFAADSASGNVAKVGNTEYATIDEAIANWTNGTTLTLLADVTLSDVITLSSQEHHYLALGTYTMTAASGKDAIEIKSYGRNDRGESGALTITADVTNPGGINAGTKACITYKYDATLAGNQYDRPIIYIKGGVFAGNSYSGIKANGHSSAQDKCATFNISGGTFNCGLNLTKTKLIISGGIFNGSVSCTGGGTSHRLISGGTFKSFGFMTADADSKFGVGTALKTYNVGCYVDDNGYLVVGGPVVTEAGETFEASSANYGGWSSYLKYSSAATNGLYYTSVEEALADNNKSTGSVTVYVDELDMAGISYAGTIVVPEGKTLKILNAPEGLKVEGEADIVKPVAKIGETEYMTLSEAFAAVTDDAQTVTILSDVTEKLTGAYLRGNIVAEEDVTITLTNSDWVYCPYTFVIGENVTLKTPALFYYAGGAVIEGTLITDAYYQRYAGAKLYVKGTMTVNSETFILRYTDNDPNAGIYVDGGTLNASVIYFYQGMISATNGTINVGTYWQTNETDGQGSANLVLDNSTLTVTVYDYPAKATGNSTVTLKNGSTMDCKNGGFTYGESAAISVDSTSAIIGKGGEAVKLPVAKIGSKSYATLAEAFAAAQNGDTIVLLSDIEITGETFTIPAGKSLTLDMNGKKITATDNKAAKVSYEIFYIYGELSVTGNGTIELTSTSNDTSWAKSSTIFHNRGGVLTVENGTYKHLGGTCMAFVVDNNANSFGDATTTINGGTLDSTYIAIRNRMEYEGGNGGGNGVAALNVNGGSITGVSRAIWAQASSASVTSPARGEINVTGGEIGLIDTARSAGATSMTTISGGEVAAFKGEVGELKVTGGSITGTTTILSAAGEAVDYVVNSEGLYVEAVKVAKIGSTDYATIEEALAALNAGDTLVLLADVEGDLVLPANVTLAGNGKQITGTLYLMGNTTFEGHVKANAFDFENVGTVINIPEGACFELTGTGRMIIGHGCTFNITGTVTDAKTANKADLTPSLVMPGASFTGAGVTFNVTNAYIKVPSSYCSSSKSASGTFEFNISNSIWESAGKLAFEAQSTAATVNFNLKNSVLTTGSHLVFGVSRGEIVIDNSNVNVGTSNQIENQSTMIVKNGSVVNGAVATSSNAKNPGTLIIENATYSVTGDFSGSDLGTGTLIVKNGANFTAGSVTNANIQIDAAGMQAGDVINVNANLSKLAGTIEVVNNDKLEAEIVDGKIVLAVKPVASINGVNYATLADAFAAAQAGDVIVLIADVESSDRIYVAAGKDVTLDLAGHVLSGTCNASQSTLVYVENGAKLTVKDSAENGKITYAQGTSNVGWTVDVKGEFVLESGTIELTGDSWSIGYAVDVRPNSWGTEYTTASVFTMNGGSIVSSDGAVRVASSSAAEHKNVSASFVMNGGLIDAAWDGVFVQQSDAIYDDLSFTMNGGTIESDLNPVRVYGPAPTGYVNDQDCMSIDLAGGTMTYTGTATQTWVIEGILRVGGGSSVETILDNGDLAVSATIAQNTDTPENYKWVEVADGNYTLAACEYVAQIGDVKYESLADAIAAAQAGDTITLIRDVTTTSSTTVPAGKNVTIDLNGKTIAGTDNSTGSFGLINLNPGADLTIIDNVGTGKITLTATNNRGWNGYSSVISNQRGKFTVNGGTIEHLGGTDMAYAIDNLTNGKGTYAETIINNGIVKSPYRAIRQFLNGTEAQNILTVNGGVIEGANKAIWMQGANKFANNGALTVEAGAQIKGNIYLDTADGTTEWPVTISVEASALSGESTILVDSYVPAKYYIVENNGVYSVECGLVGSGTEADPYIINNVDDLILFRDSVNAGETKYNASGVYVALAADIDLAGIDWSVNIGDACNTTFDGIFDGQNHTIKNLTGIETAQTSDGYICTGLFGAIYGSAQIKNLTIENVNIDAGNYTGNNVGAVVGFVYQGNGAVIENVHVIGNININAPGAYGVGALVGYAYYGNSLTIKNCSVEANDGSAINARSAASGIIGYSSSYGLTVENCNVKGVALNATAIAGGLAGVVTGGTFAGNTVEDVTITVNGANWKNSAAIAVGTLASTSVTVSDTIYSNVNVTDIVGSQYAEQPTTPVDKVQAKIGDCYYTTLAAALKAAQAGDTIILLAPVVVAAGETLTLNKAVTIEYTSNNPGEDMITNRGTLVIDGATLVYTNTDTTANNVTVSTISCEPGSVLEVKSGTVKNDSANNAESAIYAYAIDLLTNGSLGDVTATISGGEVISTNYMAIRQFNNGTACKNTLTISGGYIYGAKRAIQVHINNDAAYLTITGGKVEAGTDGYALCLFPTDATNISVTGGEFIGTVYSGTNGIISGGTFDAEPYSGYAIDGYEFVKNSDGKYALAKVEEPKVDDSHFTLSSRSLLLEDIIQIRYVFDLSVIAEASSDKGVLIWGNKADADNYDVTTAFDAKFVANGSVFDADSEGIPAKNMGDVQYYAAYALIDGEYVYSQVREFSPKMYSELVLAKTGSEWDIWKTLVTSLMHYGAYAQLQFNYKTDDLMNSGLDSFSFDDSILDDYSFNRPSTAENGFTYYSASLNLVGKVEYIYAYAVDTAVTGTDLYLEYTVGGKTLDVKMRHNNGKYYDAVLPGLPAKDLDTTYTVRPYYMNGSEKVYGPECTFGAYQYANAVINSEKMTETTKNLARAVVAYQIAALNAIGRK